MSFDTTQDNLTNVLFEDRNQTSSSSLNNIDKQLFSVISYILLLMGSAAFLANSVIFTLLVQKSNKLASEILVLTNLVIDGLYALNLAWVGLCNVADIYVDRIV